MKFKTYQDLLSDTKQWERELPEFDAICGVPRSGLLPATILATVRNTRLVPLNMLLTDPANAIANSPLRNWNQGSKKPAGNRLLVVDDTASNGITLKGIQASLAQTKHDLDIEYGVVYATKESSKFVNHFRCQLPQPRLFEWNWFRHNAHMYLGCCDMDGVLCEDWKSRQEQNEDPEFVSHVLNAKPLWLPPVELTAVVTSRIERYRAETESWLHRHGVKFQHLIMHPAKTPGERRVAGDHAQRKAEAYMRFGRSHLFVESDIHQARTIFQLTGKTVLCTDTMTCLSL